MKKLNEKQTLVNEKFAADYLSVSYETMRKRIRPQKQIPYVRIASSVRYKLSDLEAYIERRTVKAAV
jgi:excisionase family DNA binding protein